MKGKKVLKVVSKVLGILLLIIVIVLFVLGAYKTISKYLLGNEMPKIFGYATAIVMSGSMEPEIAVDDMIIIKSKDEYAVGDVITFLSGSSHVTHRIMQISDEGYTTKGDANNTPDSEIVKKEMVVGEVVGKIAVIGGILYWFQTPIGMVVALIIVLLLVFSDSIISKLVKKKKAK
jgi:signal peptidase I